MSKNAIFRGKRHDNKISKVQILLSRNFVVIAQAPISRGISVGRGRNACPLLTFLLESCSVHAGGVERRNHSDQSGADG